MTNAVKSTQVLYTSADYVKAANTAGKIEKTISLIESGNATVDFSQYMKAYSELLEKVVATNDMGHNNNPNMRVAHKKLTDTLQGLDKRATAICAKIGIAPHSKALIEMLKADNDPPEKPTSMWTASRDKWKWDKWTWTDVAKYSAGGAAAIIAARQWGSLAIKILGAIPDAFNVITNVSEKGGEAANTAATLVEEFAKNTSGGLNEVRGVFGMQKVAKDQEVSDGATFLASVTGAAALGKFASSTFSAAGFTSSLAQVLIAYAGLNHISPNITQKATDKFNETRAMVNELWQNNPAAGDAVAGVLLGLATWNQANILDFFVSNSGLMWRTGGYGITLAYLAKALEEWKPGFIKSLTDQVPGYKELIENTPTHINAIGTDVQKSGIGVMKFGMDTFNADPIRISLFGGISAATLGLVSPLTAFIGTTLGAACSAGLCRTASEATINSYKNDGIVKSVADAGQSVLKNLFNDRGEYFRMITESLTAYKVGHFVSYYLPFIQTRAAAAATAAATTAANAIPYDETVTTIPAALVRILNGFLTPRHRLARVRDIAIRSVVQGPTRLAVDMARRDAGRDAGNIARTGYLDAAARVTGCVTATVFFGFWNYPLGTFALTAPTAIISLASHFQPIWLPPVQNGATVAFGWIAARAAGVRARFP